MSDVTAAELNTFLGIGAFDDNNGAGPLILDLSALTEDSMTVDSNLAEAIFKLVRAASEAAAQLQQGTGTYPAVVRTIQTTGGVAQVRLSGTVNVLAPIDYESVSGIS